jgi:hypothetical protein
MQRGRRLTVGALHISECLTVDVRGLLPTQSDFQTAKSVGSV